MIVLRGSLYISLFSVFFKKAFQQFIVLQMCIRNMQIWFFIFCALLMTKSLNVHAAGLNRFVRRYELTDIHIYPNDIEKLHSKMFGAENNRTDLTVQVTFESFGKTFDFLISEDFTFHRALIHVYGGQNINSNYSIGSRSAVYEGRLNVEPRSYIMGIFLNDVFAGIVNMGNETYFIEPASKYFQNLTESKRIVVYRDSDVIYQTVTEYDDIHKQLFFKKHSIASLFSKEKSYINESICDKLALTKQIGDSRRWTTEKSTNKSKQRACIIEMVADHTFYQFLESDSEKVASTLSLHTKFADHIFRSTDFDGDGKPDDIRIIVGSIVIYKNKENPNYPMVAETKNISLFLRRFSRRIQNYCLSMCMCNRVFLGKAIGESFRANPDPSEVGGICQKPVLVITGEKYSTNTGVITSTSTDGKKLPLAITLLAFTHELGHGFGSPHDPLKSLLCSPNGKSGNYVMFPTSVDGSRPNSKKFSPCSRAKMQQVIANKGSCLVSNFKTECGNGIREDNEECDCGVASICNDLDMCCTPKGGIGPDPECTIRRNAGYTCSPKEKPCCSTSCSFIPASWKRKCYTLDNPCLTSTCDGNSADCPLGSRVRDGLPCLGTSRTCNKGSCNSTVCQDHHLEDCICSSSGEYECYVCCVNAINGCVPASKFGYYIADSYPYVRYLGTRCKDNSHECNSDGQCINPSGPSHTTQWLPVYWFYMIFMALVIACGLCFYWIMRKRRQSRSTYYPQPLLQPPAIGPSEYAPTYFYSGSPYESGFQQSRLASPPPQYDSEIYPSPQQQRRQQVFSIT